MNYLNYDGITDGQLRMLHSEWEDGRSKNDIERSVFNDPASHGKAITRIWRVRLGIETEKRRSSSLEIDRLTALLIENGIDPAAHIQTAHGHPAYSEMNQEK